MEKGISYIKFYMLWENVCFFLNKLAKIETMPANVWAKDFPQLNEEAERPLPEDFAL